MANLLPQDTQKMLFNRMVVRIAIVTSLLLSFVALVATAALLPGYLTLRTEDAALSYEIESLQQAGGTQATEDRREVNATNKRLRTIEGTFLRSSQISEAIRVAIEARPQGMILERIAYDIAPAVGSTTPHALQISGILADRTDQSAYLTALRTEGMFTQVEIPISALARADQKELTVMLYADF